MSSTEPRRRTGRSGSGSAHTVFAPAYGSPFIHNLDEGRRYGTIEDFRNFVKLAYLSPSMHHSGGTICEPVNLPVNKRHFDMVYAHMRYSDKCFMGSVTHPDRAQDTVEMAKILFGDNWIDPETGKPRTCVINLINANSPMTFDDTMLGAAKVYARSNQACIITPFILAGAMSPVTVAGTATQLEAQLLDIVESSGSELVVLARYMQVLSQELCKRMSGRVINIHHSFLPGFKGAKPYHQAHDRGVKLIGATAHYVTQDLDEGPIIEQVVERVDHTYRPEQLVEVGRDTECQALARAVRFHIEHRVFLNGNKTVVFR